MDFSNYNSYEFYDALFSGKGVVRDLAKPLFDYMGKLSIKDLKNRQKAAESIFFREGVTFNVYGDKKGSEKIFPFDLIPLIISGKEWLNVEKGLIQRVKALNCFITDVYGPKEILKKKLIPQDLVFGSKNYLPQCEGLKPKNDIWVHISGSDLIRDESGKFYVLEDNLRCPSGVSYVLENRAILKRTFSDAFTTIGVRSVDNYSDHLLTTLQEASYSDPSNSKVVLLTPGPYNSAYFEHVFLAQQMGIDLVEPGDLMTDSNSVKMKTTSGLEKIDVIYRRVDDEFLDPKAFRKDSLLGVPGVMKLYKEQKVALVNAPGAGIADDKSIYPYVSDMIKFYLQEEPIISNVKTYWCSNPAHQDYILSHMNELVIKATNLSGGYGMLIGSKASEKEIEDFRKKIIENPKEYIAQPIVNLSTAPTLIERQIEPRHVDLRPFVLSSSSTYVTPGGLTRVALRKNSLVVNSSQGGGSKDTWITKGGF